MKNSFVDKVRKKKFSEIFLQLNFNYIFSL